MKKLSLKADRTLVYIHKLKLELQDARSGMQHAGSRKEYLRYSKYVDQLDRDIAIAKERLDRETA